MDFKCYLEDPPPRTPPGKGQPWDVGGKTDVLEALVFVEANSPKWAVVWIGGGYGAQNRVDLLREAGCETRTVRLKTGSSLRKVYARLI